VIYLKDIESHKLPREGIFWFHDANCIACYSIPVNIENIFEYREILHKEIWDDIKQMWKVNNEIVSYDYFPRGRVEVITITDLDGNPKSFDAYIYFDKCLNNQDCMKIIRNEFNLNLSSVTVHYVGQLFVDGSHYTCANCRK
jgi:hypothetical protein